MTSNVERMSRVDTAWLRMDNDVNLMMIVGVWLLTPKIAYDALCERVESKLLRYDRFRQKVVQDAMGASWVGDDDFDVHRHVVTLRVLEELSGDETAAELGLTAGHVAVLLHRARKQLERCMQA